MIKIQVKNGKKTSFWNDWWPDENPLNGKYPRLFNLDSNKEKTVEKNMRNNRWIQQCRSILREGRSKEEFEDLAGRLEEVSLIEGVDKWICPEGPNNKFEVAWMRKLIINWVQ